MELRFSCTKLQENGNEMTLEMQLHSSVPNVMYKSLQMIMEDMRRNADNIIFKDEGAQNYQSQKESTLATSSLKLSL